MRLANEAGGLFLAMTNLRAHATLLAPEFPTTLSRLFGTQFGS